MSCNESEEGTIIIPKSLWASFKQGLREAYNTALAEDFVVVERVLATVKAAHKGKRNVDWSKALSDEWGRGHADFRSDWIFANPLKVLDTWYVKEAVLPHGATSLRAFKKKDFPPAGRTTMQFRADEGCFAFDDASHTVCWLVRENNHACDTARASHMGKAFFNALAALEWGRGSGGVIAGSNEYLRDGGRGIPGGGGNRINSAFGPRGEEAQAEYAGMSLARWRQLRQR